MTDFTTSRIGDIASLNEETYSNKENWKYVNYLDTGNITNNKINQIQLINIANEKLPSRAKRKVKNNDIIYSTVRPNQCHYGIIKQQPENLLVSTGFTVISVDKTKADPDYVYFYLTKNDLVEGLHAIAEQSTSAYPSIKAADIENLEIKLPMLQEQKKIAAVLMSIENKMVLNDAINENLEKQIQAIFLKIFPDVLNTDSDNTLESIITFSNGKKRPLETGNIPVYGGNGVLAYTNSSNSSNCVIIGRVGAYCGNTFLCTQDCWVSDNAIQAISKTSDSQLFIYYLLKNASIPSRHIGTGQPLMTQGILNAIPCVLPNEKDIITFIDLAEPMQREIDTNIYENTKLSSLRDILLPKLMSGEIDISEITI